MACFSCRSGLASAALLAASVGFGGVSHADEYTFTSCHISSSSCVGGSVPLADGFGTVTLTQDTTVATSVDFVVTLNNGNTFVETGAGGGSLFLFNDTLANSAVTATSPNTSIGTITTSTGTTFNTSLAIGGSTNQSPIMADGTGTFTAQVSCTTSSDCNGGSPMPGGNINNLEFTVTNATLAQLETANAKGNLFVADILCGANQPQCAGGLTGPVDVSVPGPILGAGLPGLVAGCLGLIGLARRRKMRHA